MQIRIHDVSKQLIALICSLLLVVGGAQSLAQAQEPQPAAAAEEQAPKIPNDQLDSLVAPIALYQDELLAQVLVASTYPLEIVQLQQFLAKHKDLKDKALADAVMKQNWDPSIQAMAALPDVVKRLADDIKWTTDLGNAVLAQQSDVMEAVQRMRAKAKEKGNLKSNEQINVETKVVENKTVIVVEQTKPDVVYVPSYDPVVVYGAAPYPYPPIYYPPPGYYAAGMAISFGVGVAMGAAWGGGWCCNSGWGGNNEININNNNTFVNNSNRQNVNNSNRQNNSGNRTGNRTGGSNSWQHNPQHRGGTPYANKSTANKFGGQTGGRQNQAGTMDRGGRQQGGGLSGGNQPSAGTMDRGSGGGNRSGGGGGDKVGNRSTSSGASSKGGGFGSSGSGRSSGSSAKASSSRGSSSMGGSRGASRGGGGRRR